MKAIEAAMIINPMPAAAGGVDHPPGIVDGVDQLRVDAVLVGVVAHRPHPDFERHGDERKCGIDAATDRDERRQDAFRSGFPRPPGVAPR